MNCRKCGAEALDSSLYCRLCGSKVKPKSDFLWRLRMAAIAILLVIIVLLIIASSHAQSPEYDDYADVVFVNHRVVKITKMMNKGNYDDCCRSRFTVTGTITEVQYKADQIESFTLKVESGASSFNGQPGGRYEPGFRKNVEMGATQYPNATRYAVGQLIKEGKRVHVRGCLCGMGGYWYPIEIDLAERNKS